MTDIQAWIAERAEKDEKLYERYGKPLEAEHKGEFVAISDDGEILLDRDELALTMRAVGRFGAGNFALQRIGYEYNIRWRNFKR